jgi:tripartite-type tricarboxylate transporter receptor subunit TctC
MRQNNLVLAAAALALAAGLTLGPAAHAQGFPTRPVTIVVPYPPGGLIDLVARIIQPRLQAELGQSVVIDNRSGAGGNVGAEGTPCCSPIRRSASARTSIPT